MGIYFNPGNDGFRKSAEDELYVDKTGLLNITNKYVNSEKNCIAVSHARRFGKSQAASMLEAYYSRGCDSEDLFSGFEISGSPDFKKHLNMYNVIHIDVSSFSDDYGTGLVNEIKRHIFDEFKKIYPEIDYEKSTSAVLMQVYERSVQEINGENKKIPFVIIMDEWDCVIRNYPDEPEFIHEYLQFLHSLFKSKESKIYLALGYITGIVPIKKIKDESALNNFREYTMLNSKVFTEYFGFTEDEVRILCNRYDMSFESVKTWYNGYLINGEHMYNPDSVYQAMTERSIESYWKGTSAFETINQYIALDFDGLKEDVMKMLNGDTVTVDTETFQNDLSCIGSRDEALTALIHLGYLGYDRESETAFIPNYEVAKSFHAALKKGSWKDISDILTKCNDILNATIRKDSTKVADLLELAHERYSSVLQYNDENSLSCTITMAYYTAPAYYTVIRECSTGKGFADIVFIPRADTRGKPAIVAELKWDKDADTAIKQIKEKRYAGSLKGYGKEVLLVGVNYDKVTKKHECVIESVELN